MKRIPVIEGLSLAEYLAFEEEQAKTVTEPVFFTWQVPPTVIYGQHQIPAQEINETFCHENNIAIVQRQSGGGCVYADEGNVMVSFIIPTEHVRHTFESCIRMLADALQTLGYEAVTTQHNDILVGERKVSGSACYWVDKIAIVHATMMYDVNIDVLQQAITPTTDKLRKHAVQSVRQRVTNLRAIRDLGPTADFRKQLEKKLET